MEAEANRFASLVLLPKPIFRQDLEATRDPDLEHTVRLSNRYEASKEATGRAYIGLRDEPVAFVSAKDGRVLRLYKAIKFSASTIGKDELMHLCFYCAGDDGATELRATSKNVMRLSGEVDPILRTT